MRKSKIPEFGAVRETFQPTTEYIRYYYIWLITTTGVAYCLRILYPPYGVETFFFVTNFAKHHLI